MFVFPLSFSVCGVGVMVGDGKWSPSHTGKETQEAWVSHHCRCARAGNRRQQVCLIEKEKPTGVLLIKHRSQGPTVLHREGCSILSTNLNGKRL